MDVLADVPFVDEVPGVRVADDVAKQLFKPGVIPVPEVFQNPGQVFQLPLVGATPVKRPRKDVPTVDLLYEVQPIDHFTISLTHDQVQNVLLQEKLPKDMRFKLENALASKEPRVNVSLRISDLRFLEPEKV